MAIQAVTLDLSVGNSDDVLTNRGDIVKLVLKYDTVGSAVVVSIEEKQPDDTYINMWQSPSTNTDDYYIPTKTTTLSDGTDGSAEAPIPLHSAEGWRVSRVSGASSGTVTAYVTVK